MKHALSFMKKRCLLFWSRCCQHPFLFIALISSLWGTALAYADGIHVWHAAFLSLCIIIFIYLLFNTTKHFDFSNIMITKYPRLKILIAFFFLGPFCLSGTYYFQSQEMNTAIALAGIIPGLFAVTVILYEYSSTQTLPAAWQPIKLKRIFISVLLTAILMPVLIFFITQDHIFTLSTVLTLYLCSSLHTQTPFLDDKFPKESGFQALLKILLFHAGLFSIGWLL